MTLHKDLALDRLAEYGNVAQFVAFRPQSGTQIQSTARINGMAPNASFASIRDAVVTLLAVSREGAINVRSYMPDDPRSREFIYGITSVDLALDHLERLTADGLHLILNETIDTHDGGVSGVIQGAVIEFAPDDTPRAVEKPDIASLPREMGLSILETVYGFAPELPCAHDARIEFSIHPAACGWRKGHTLLWEIENAAGARDVSSPRWPNRFSRHIGDKCFGLLIANYLDVPVPQTLAISRRVAPFQFGRQTGSLERWIRTCPAEPQPGRFTTAKGWLDPFKLLADEDNSHEIASVLSQQAIEAKFSGAAIIGAQGALIVEGRPGEGDMFMLGTAQSEPLPIAILRDVQELHSQLSNLLGPVRIEWVHDGAQAWVVQLHVGATSTSSLKLVEGDPDFWCDFDVSLGLTQLRTFLKTLPKTAGLRLIGDVGLTSHVADLVRKWDQPALIYRR